MTSRCLAGVATAAAALAAACGGGGGGAGASNPAAPTPPSTSLPAAPLCRTYPVSGSSTSVSGTFSATVTYSNSFSTVSNEFRSAGNYADSIGTRFAFVDVTSYHSVGDFVNEVVQSGGTSGQAIAGSSTFTDPTARWTSADIGRGIKLSSGFGADAYRIITAVNSPTSITLGGGPASSTSPGVTWAVSIIPPVTLASGLNRSGDTAVPATTVNSYDLQGRLTSTVATSLGATVTQTYRAWDQMNRPTGGTMSNGTSTGTLTRTFDDAARTATTTIVYPFLSTVMTDVFDTNGIEVSASQRDSSGSSTTTTWSMTATATACK